MSFDYLVKKIQSPAWPEVKQIYNHIMRDVTRTDEDNLIFCKQAIHRPTCIADVLAESLSSQKWADNLKHNLEQNRPEAYLCSNRELVRDDVKHVLMDEANAELCKRIGRTYLIISMDFKGASLDERFFTETDALPRRLYVCSHNTSTYVPPDATLGEVLEAFEENIKKSEDYHHIYLESIKYDGDGTLEGWFGS